MSACSGFNEEVQIKPMWHPQTSVGTVELSLLFIQYVAEPWDNKR